MEGKKKKSQVQLRVKMEEEFGVANKPWADRARLLTQMLMISGTLNIGLISSLIYFALQQKQAVRSFEAPERRFEKTKISNEELLQTYSQARFEDLVLRLENKDLLEEGYT